MSYAIYLEDSSGTYRVPVNPEEIQVSRSLDTEKYRMLTGEQVVIPAGVTLEEISFEAEFPALECHYTNPGFIPATKWEDMLRRWQKEKTVVRCIMSNGVNADINNEVLVISIKTQEKAGEEGDKYISIDLIQYIAPSKRYVAVQTVKKSPSVTNNPAVVAGKTHTVVKGDTLWGIAKKYYGSGDQYNKIYQANSDKIKNPNLIYIGQVLSIPI